jgi:uncharacterized protein
MRLKQTGAMSVTVLVLPGYGGSGPEHWQSRWQREYPGWKQVTQKDWERPVCSAWVESLNAAIQATRGPLVLVAHSLGCLLVAHWAASHTGPVQAALLVAPPDPEAPLFPAAIEGFAPVPQQTLPFASCVVTSSNDPYDPKAQGRALAQHWGSQLVEIADAGHLNAASGLGSWPQGKALLRDLGVELSAK